MTENVREGVGEEIGFREALTSSTWNDGHFVDFILVQYLLLRRKIIAVDHSTILKKGVQSTKALTFFTSHLSNALTLMYIFMTSFSVTCDVRNSLLEVGLELSDLAGLTDATAGHRLHPDHLTRHLKGTLCHFLHDLILSITPGSWNRILNS